MDMKNWKKEVFTIPNLMSLGRLVMIPIYLSIYLRADSAMQYYAAGGILALSCLTDAFDGKIARKYNMISTLGKILDPLADKLTQFTLTVCLSLRYPILLPVLVLFVIKELFQIILGAVNLFRGRMLPGALMAGKVCTTVLFVSFIALVLFPNMVPIWINGIALLDAAFLAFSFGSYIHAYFGKNSPVEDLKKN